MNELFNSNWYKEAAADGNGRRRKWDEFCSTMSLLALCRAHYGDCPGDDDEEFSLHSVAMKLYAEFKWGIDKGRRR